MQWRAIRRDQGGINLVKISVFLGIAAIGYFGWIYLPLWIDHIGMKKAVRVAANSAYTVREETAVKRALLKEFKDLNLQDSRMGDDGAVVVEPTTFNEDNITVELIQTPPEVTVSIEYKRSVVWPFVKKQKEMEFSYSHTESLAPTKW